jgi:hypothetical protein
VDSCLRRDDRGEDAVSLRLIEIFTLLSFLPEREEDYLFSTRDEDVTLNNSLFISPVRASGTIVLAKERKL